MTTIRTRDMAMIDTRRQELARRYVEALERMEPTKPMRESIAAIRDAFGLNVVPAPEGGETMTDVLRRAVDNYVRRP